LMTTAVADRPQIEWYGNGVRVKFPDQHFAMTESHGQEIHSDPISP
jgi:hypothetical protein